MIKLKPFLICLFLLLNSIAIGQEFKGKWYGVLNVYGQDLALVINLTNDSGEWKGTMDSPDQKAFGIPMSKVEVKDQQISFSIDKLNVKYDGKLISNEEIVGKFHQSGFEADLIFKTSVIEKTIVAHLQEPIPPFPYSEEEVSFDNENAAITFSGTLTTPVVDSRTVPVVILISGSGPQDRNEEILGHKPFLILSDRLTREGIAVLRYDDRGTGKTTGSFSNATSEDFAADVMSAIKYVKTRPYIDSNKIIVMGHSEGAMIATMVAARTENVFAVVSLAGPGILGSDLLREQQFLISKANGATEKELKQLQKFNDGFYPNLVGDSINIIEKNTREFLEKTASKLSKKDLEKSGLTSREDWVKTNISAFVNPWMLYFLNYNPIEDLQNVQCHYLALNGSVDLQVAVKSNLESIRKNCNPKAPKIKKVIEIPGLNHLFQPSKTGNPTEYGGIEITFDESALKEITGFMHEILK